MARISALAAKIDLRLADPEPLRAGFGEQFGLGVDQYGARRFGVGGQPDRRAVRAVRQLDMERTQMLRIELEAELAVIGGRAGDVACQPVEPRAVMREI